VLAEERTLLHSDDSPECRLKKRIRASGKLLALAVSRQTYCMDLDDVYREAEATFLAIAGRPVIFRRGEQQISWTAIQDSTVFEIADANGVMVSFESTDFIGSAGDLMFDEETTPVVPTRGDRIWKRLGTTTLVYEVLNLGNAVPPYRYCDPERTSIRLHTKLIEEVGGV
jgi:hypothetical protein